MSSTAARPHRWAPWIVAAATTAVLATIVTLAAVWPGFDAQQTPLTDSSVWALQTGDGRRYAKVNTALHELETVKDVENPSGIAQSSGRLFVYTDGDTKFADVSLSSPTDLTADAESLQATPSGTSVVATAGDYVAYLTDSGAVYGAQMSTGGATVTVDPYADQQVPEGQERPTLQADAVTVTADGILYAVSLAHQTVVTARADTGRILSQDDIRAPDATAVQISAVGDDWVVYDPDGAQLWTSAHGDPITVDSQPGAVLAAPAAASADVYLADSTGLVSVALDGSGSTRTVDASGAPAAPTTVAGVVYGAWLGADAGTLWSSAAGTSDLDYAGSSLGDTISPQFSVNGTSAILNETASGWVWTLPDGQLVGSSQEWNSDDQTQQRENQQLETQRVIDPKPPVAVADSFGVRAGHDVVLPVLLNDHDPNEDVLSIIPESVTGLDPGFGAVVTTNQDQQLVVTVAAGATGSATFSYRITDGTQTDGLNSDAATVTLTVVPDDVNNAPVWCGVDGCLATWPAPQVTPGGTVSTDVLGGWVDPDGDPVYLAGAVNQSGVGTVSADPAGTVTYQHPDPNAADALSVQLDLTVSDSRGATAEKAMTVSVTPSPQLSADSFALTGVAGTPLTVDLASHVHGAGGAVTLSSAKALNEGAGTVTANTAALSFVFASAAAGSYVLQYAVRDASGEATASVRVTLRDPAATQISTPPLTAFVRPSEDASVDVLSAVSNPAGLVLLVSDLRPEPTGDASLSVDAVGQNLIRVSGSTADGQPGTLGTVRYTVSDGSGAAGTTTSGELTVILLPAASAEPPIAVDDTVTVRAGAQVDIPVLDNDTAPAGALIAVDPSTIVNESGAGLAFATPKLVRYLAPAQAGTYSISYTVYRLGFPQMTDTARIFVTVLPADSNTAPVPKDLEGRVLSGSSVSIAFDGFGIDPDGDSVTLDRVVSQPAHGSAAISATGDAIVYTSAPGSSGQDSFTYQVRDAFGATGTATVRVGILDGQSDPSPITYSDYAQAQAGADSTVVVTPADNDVDPAGSELDLIDVVPNAQAGTAEYEALEAMLADVDTDSGRVRLSAGTELGTFSFVYTVRNRTGDTAQGLIVLKVVRDAVPDYPVVTDTALTAETREDLPTGVDVVTGKVAWTGGDVSSLSLSLWGDASGLTVRGWKISGALTGQSRVVPFQLTGTSFSGAEVVSYGFLRIPGDDDIPLTLRASFAQVQVNEKGSVEVDMSQAVAVPRGQTLQVGTEGLAASGARSAAACTLASGTTVRYDAGAGAPFSDVCTVPVKLAGQSEYTYLALHITVIAEDPQPQLRAASQSVSPGSSAVYDLTQMTTWQDHADLSGLTYSAAYSGDQFTVTQSGSTLTITAKDAARPGREEPVVVKLPGYPESAAATLTLTVGPAPSTLPKGGTVTQQCSQAGGNTSCTISVVGVGGEVNPLPGTPLTLVSVTGASNCAGVSFTRAGDSAVTASWASDAAGAGNCTGTFVVQDAQGRQSSGDRNGTVILDLQGLPANPGRLTWTGYTGDSVSLTVLSQGSSYPAVTGYRVTGSNGATVTCDASGRCPAIPATNGQKVTYQAWAVNSVGESRSSVGIEAWAYRAPAAPAAVSSKPTGDGTATITVTISDPSTGSVALRRTGDGASLGSQSVTGAGTVTFPDVAVGTNVATGENVTVVPSTSFTVPPSSVVAGGSSEGTTATVAAWGIGRPAVTLSFADGAVSNFSGSVTVTATVATANAGGGTLYIGFGSDPNDNDCDPDQAVAGLTGSASTTYTKVTIVWPQQYYACAEYVYGGASFGVTQVSDRHALSGSIPKPTGDATYTIALGGADGAQTRTATLTHSPSLSTGSSGDFTVRYFAGSSSYDTFEDALSRLTSGTTITAKTCSTDGSSCSDAVTITATTKALYLVKVSFGSTCDQKATVTNPTTGAAVDSGDWGYTAPTTATPTATVAFAGDLSALGSTTYTYASCGSSTPSDPPTTSP